MNDEYISRQRILNYIDDEYCMHCEHSDGVCCENCHYEDVRIAIKSIPTAEVQPADRWINAQTNPPTATDGETSDYVLVLRADGRQCVCYYVYDDDEGNYWCSEDEKSIYDIDEITRWQPLPKPPNE